MQPQNYHCTITAPITAAEAFEKISRVGDWWAVNFKGNAKNLYDRFTVHFARTTWSIMEIVEVVPDQRIVWKVVDCYLPIFQDPYLWKNNHIAWEISTEGAQTRVTMTHIGLVPGVECYEDCRKGWNFYIGESLLGLLIAGKGLPGSGIFADIFVGSRKYEGLMFSKTEPFPDNADGYIIVDIRENSGERVLSAYAVDTLDIKGMSPQQLKGDYYMVLENRPVSGNIQPLEDLRQIIPA
ncbi:MAG TPA: SRPBCC domain-containing protein [Puia sp.]|nr:SRPBCC domain-containing protein [Puia sp.]